jgi:thiol-disulfide isomerase/thioredoxin
MRGIVFIIMLCVMPVAAVAQEKHAPPLALRSLDGQTVRLSDYRGKVVMLNFWATWCPPCRAEMPELVRLQREYRRRGLQIVGVTVPPLKRREMRRFVRSIKINYPILYGTRATGKMFETGETLPVTIIIDREGNVRDKIIGILEPEEFEQKVKPLLR